MKSFKARLVLLVPFLLMLASHVFLGCGGGEADPGQQAESVPDSTQVDSAKVAQSGKNTKKKPTAGKASNQNKNKRKVPEGVPVKVAAVEYGEISEYVLYSATIEAEETIDIYAEASGLVRKVLVEEGDRIQAGQALVILADEDLKLREADSRLSFQKLENQFLRKKEMFERNILSKEAYEDLRFNLDQARVGWDRALLALDHATVRAPISGVIAERMVKLGDRIGQTTKLYILVSLESLIARVHVPGQSMHNLAVDQHAMITTEFLPGKSFSGTIMRISPVVDPSSGTFKVTLGIIEDENGLRPGMFVNAHIVTATHEKAILVPKRAVVYDDGFPHVFVVNDSTASKIQFKKGFEDTQFLEVLAGVSGGEKIVVVGQNGLKDKAKVRIIKGESLRIPAKLDSTQTKNQTS